MSEERKISEIYETPHFRKGISNSHNTDNKLLEKFPDNYKNCRFILLDTETTGLKLETDRLISINAVEMINGELTGIQFNAYLNKRFNERSRPLMYYLADYNYSRKDNVKKSLETFLEFVSDSIVITHNALFDMKFINAELKRYGLRQIPLGQCLCTLRILRNLKKIGKLDKNFRLRLCDLCNYYDIDVFPEDLHQGIVDTIVFGRCVAKMLEDGICNDYNNYDYDEANSFINYSHIDLNCSFDDTGDELSNEEYKKEDIKENEDKDENNNIIININKPIISKSQDKQRKNNIINKTFNKKNYNIKNAFFKENVYDNSSFKKKNYNTKNEFLKENKYENFNFKPLQENNVRIFNENENENENFYENKKSNEKVINYRNKSNNNNNKKKIGKENYYNKKFNNKILNNSLIIPKENNDFKKYKSNIIFSSNNCNENENIVIPKEQAKIKFLKNAFKSYIKDNQQKIQENSILNNTII